MTDLRFPKATRAHAEQRHALAPDADDAFRDVFKAVFAAGAGFAHSVKTQDLLDAAER